MSGIKSKVRRNLNDRLEAMTVKHSELEEDQKQKLTRLHTYDKFATLHKELNHHSYSSQYYWVFFLLRRFIFITVCVKSNDGYWQSSVFIVLSMLCSAYVYAIFPFKLKRKNYVENFNEMMIFMCAIIQQVLAGITMNNTVGSDSRGLISEGARTRQGLAHFVMASISFVIAVNLYFASGDFLHQVLLHFKRWYIRLSAKQTATLK